jgi:F0F1-type ATP synthase delta subunit
MFHAERWAGAFLAVSGSNADEAFLCLNALAAQVKNVQGALMGHSASGRLEKILRESAAQSAAAAAAGAAATAGTENPAVEYALRFLCLLVEKNCFRYINPLLQKIEQNLDAQNGILNVVVEAAAVADGSLAPVESSFEEKLTLMIKDRTGAAGVKMKTIVRPELLGGYILRIGSHYIDASLKGQLESMAAHLGTPNIGADTGGCNG